MDKMKIGVIDSGLYKQHKAFSKISNIFFYNVLDHSDDVYEEELTHNRGGHGTGVFSIIVKHLEKRLTNVEFHIIKIFDSRGFTNEDCLLDAINYCIERNINIVNLSLGIETDIPSDRLRKICQKAYEKNMILVSSTSDSSVKTYPAYFSNVFGVVGGVMDLSTQYGVIDNKPIEFIGKGNMQRVATLNDKYVFVAGNSYATAHITGIIANLKLSNKVDDFQSIKEYMFANGRRDIRLFTNRDMQYLNDIGWIGNRIKPTDSEATTILRNVFDKNIRLGWMKKIALYPFSNKEMAAFRTFADMCEYEIVEIYDFPKFAAKEKSIHIQGKQIKINWNIDDNSFRDIDTIVIGHVFDTAIELNSIFAEKIINRCIELKKNFYVFDPHLYLELQNKVKDDRIIKIYHPDNNFNNHKNIIKATKLHNFALPNISVVGVSPRCGKFTTQLKIKKLLEDKGYSVGWLATEPQSELFGSDYCFPIGEEINNILLGVWPYYLSSIVSAIEKYKKPDIILSGHQSSLIKLGTSHISTDVLKSINFLSSIKPDAVICSVNPDYANEHLDKMVEFIRVVFNIPILIFSLSRMRVKLLMTGSGMVYLSKEIISEDEWQEIANGISNRFGKNVVDPLNNKYDNILADSILFFF
jgi:uncharacterized NAD-dependent epimerase/dehydratase family protein